MERYNRKVEAFHLAWRTSYVERFQKRVFMKKNAKEISEYTYVLRMKKGKSSKKISNDRVPRGRHSSTRKCRTSNTRKILSYWMREMFEDFPPRLFGRSAFNLEKFQSSK